MACQGPDLKEAKKLGSQVGEALLNELISEYNMSNQLFTFPGSRKRWEKAKKMFIKSVEELFVEDASNSF